MILWRRQVSWPLSPHSQEGGWPRALGSLNEARGAKALPAKGAHPRASRPHGRGTDYSSQVPTGRAGASTTTERPCARAAGSCSRGRGEDGVQGERGSAAGEEYRGPVLPLRAQRGEHQVRGLQGRPWPRPALSGLCVCKTPQRPPYALAAASRVAGSARVPRLPAGASAGVWHPGLVPCCCSEGQGTASVPSRRPFLQACALSLPECPVGCAAVADPVVRVYNHSR